MIEEMEADDDEDELDSSGESFPSPSDTEVMAASMLTALLLLRGWWPPLEPLPLLEAEPAPPADLITSFSPSEGFMAEKLFIILVNDEVFLLEYFDGFSVKTHHSDVLLPGCFVSL